MSDIVERVTQSIRISLAKGLKLREEGDEQNGRKHVDEAVAQFQSFIADAGDPFGIAGSIWDALRAAGFDDDEIEQRLSTANTPASRSRRKGNVKKDDLTGLKPGGKEHKDNARGSTIGPHQKGKAAKRKSFGGEKGDASRPYPRKRPANWPGGPWPPAYISFLPQDTGSSDQDEEPKAEREQAMNKPQDQLNAALVLARRAEKAGGKYPLKELKTAADSGYAPAVYALATWYLHGREVKKDHERAVTLLKEASKAGFPPAEFDLAVCYELGSGIQEDAKKAFEYYLRAACNGDLEAQAEVARCYYYGIGTDLDHTTAAEWYRIAAKRGNSDSQFALGRMLELAEGVKVDAAEALKLYRMAAAQGNDQAKEVLTRIEKRKSKKHKRHI